MAETAAAARLTAEVVCAFIANNRLDAQELPNLITTVRRAMESFGEPRADVADTVVLPTAAQIRNSVTREALISFEDGKPYKTLKRHLAYRGMTVAEYKAKWGLAVNYPTSAPAYSEKRSAMAKAVGLGRSVRKQTAAVKPAPT